MISKIIHPWLNHPISPLQPSFNSNYLYHHHIWKIKIFHAFHHQHKTPILQRCSTPVYHFTQHKQPPKLTLYSSLVWSSDFTSSFDSSSVQTPKFQMGNMIMSIWMCYIFSFSFFLNNFLKPWRYVLYRKEGKFFILVERPKICFFFFWNFPNAIYKIWYNIKYRPSIFGTLFVRN